jgi:hypothetical protein
VVIERRPATGTTVRGGASFQDHTIEVHEMYEEPVVGKVITQAEEMVIYKTLSERTATARETVRQTQVNVDGQAKIQVRPPLEIAGEISLKVERNFVPVHRSQILIALFSDTSLFAFPILSHPLHRLLPGVAPPSRTELCVSQNLRSLSPRSPLRRCLPGAKPSRIQPMPPDPRRVAVVSMSKQEFSRLEVLLRVQSGRLRVSDACVLIGLQRRQIFSSAEGGNEFGKLSGVETNELFGCVHHEGRED